MINVNEYPTSKSLIRSVQPYQNSNIYQSSINNGITGSYINTGLNQSTNLLNNGKVINYYNQPINNYQLGHLKTISTPLISQPVKVLPTKYLPAKVITDNQPLIVNNYPQSLSGYNSPLNNLNIFTNNNTIKSTNTYYNTTTTPVANIPYNNEGYDTNNYQTQNISGGYINSVTSTSYIPQINDYPTQKKTEYIYNESIQNIDNNANKEYFINSYNSNNSQYAPQENLANSYILNTSLIKQKADIFSDISPQVSNYETQSYNQENIIYNLQNEILNLKSENETFKNKLTELDRYKSEAAEARALKEKLQKLSNPRNQVSEMTSLKAKKLKNSKTKKTQINSKKNEKFNSIRKNNIKSSKKNIAFEKQVEQSFVNGDIIHNVKELEMIVRKINKSSKKMTLNLIYKATVNSDKAEEFHKKCDKAKSTLVLIETNKGKRFGGYTSTTWKGNCVDKLDKDAFIFSLDKMKIYEIIPGEKAIGCYPKFGPIFLGCQIRIYDNAFQRGGTTFEKGLNYNTKKNYELTDGDKEFKVKEIEVYEIIA